jgi:alkyl sulfatase BDS1-like metallo-beta-lactamase superfamily hydrolase
MGGRDAVFAEALKATEQGDHQWSAELLSHIIRLDVDNMEARELKARNLREIGFALTNNNWRNWFMTSALELEGKLDYSKAIDLQAPDLVKVFPLSAILESLRFRADGPRLAQDGIALAMGITFTDVSQEYALVLRNGVVEFSEAKPDLADIQIELTTSAFAEILAAVPEGGKHNSQIVTTTAGKLIGAIEAGDQVKLQAGTVDDINRFFSYFDVPNAEKFPITLK